MNWQLKNQKEILKELKEQLNDDEINYHEMFLPKLKLEIKGEEKKKFPFILIRPTTVTRSRLKRVKYELLIAVENENDEIGMNEVFDLSDKIIKILEKKFFKNNCYTLDPNSITEEFNIEDCGEDVWGKRIKFESDIPG